MRVSIRKVTPSIAQTWLDSNEEKQRHLIPAKLSQFVKDMSEGRWHENGESIIFNIKGGLMDGQHRLHAIVKTGITLHECCVVTDVNPNAFISIDTGANRTGRSIMEMHGQKNAAMKASTCRQIALFKEYGAHPGMGNTEKMPMTNALLLAALESEDAVQEVVEAVLKHPCAMRFIPPSHLCFFMWRLRGSLYEKAKQFLNDLDKGECLAKTNPVLSLRRKLFEAPRALSRSCSYTPAAKWVFLTKAWNAYVTNTPLMVLKWSSDENTPGLVVNIP